VSVKFFYVIDDGQDLLFLDPGELAKKGRLFSTQKPHAKKNGTAEKGRTPASGGEAGVRGGWWGLGEAHLLATHSSGLSYDSRDEVVRISIKALFVSLWESVFQNFPIQVLSVSVFNLERRNATNGCDLV
jgi:hypothetical protein